MAPLRSLSNPVSSFDDPFAKTSTRAGEVWFPYTGIIGNRALIGGGWIPSSPDRTNDIQYFDIRISITFWILLAGLTCKIRENQKI